ncbi:protein containing DUF179, partial [mine drainage metagenome]
AAGEPRRGYNTGMTATSTLTGHLLIAMPGLRDPDFEHTVTLICQHNEDGALGLVVNRTSAYRLQDLLQQMDISTDDDPLAQQAVLAGGPL